MDVGKLFKLPDLPSAAVNKRKWSAPQPDDATRSDASPPPPPSDSARVRPAKAARVDDEDDELPPAAEETHFFSDDDDDGGRFFGGGLTAEQQQILDIMDGGDASSSQPNAAVQDLPALRKQLVRFERAIVRNTELRVKYAEDPVRFIESEADLDAEIRALLVLTTQPERFYAEFVALGGAASLASLLSHENADIAAAAIEVIQELTDDDVLDQADAAHDGDDDQIDTETLRAKATAAMDELVDALLKNSVLELVVSSLTRFQDELDPEVRPEEAASRAVEVEGDAQAIYHALGALENLISSRQNLAEELVEKTAFLAWALSRMAGRREVDQNTSYAAEVLAILMQSSERNRGRIGTTRVRTEDDNGVDVLLSVVARYRRRAPEGGDEAEFVENVVDVLCLALFDAANKRLFLEGEGVELMVLMMKEKTAFARVRAVKVLDHAMGASGGAVCSRLVEAGGLAPLIRVLMQCSDGGKVTLRDAEHVLAILGALFTHLESDSMPRLRLLARFVAKDYEALDHLLDLRSSLTSRLDSIPTHDDDDDDEIYLARLDRGLFSLQLLDTVLAWLVMEDDAVREHVDTLLKRTGASWSDLTTTLSEYSANLGDQLAADSTDSTVAVQTKDILAALISYLSAL